MKHREFIWNVFTLKVTVFFFFFMFHLTIDPELRNDSVLTSSSGGSLGLRGSEFSGYSLEKTVGGTKLSLPFKTRLLKKGKNAIQIYTYIFGQHMYVYMYIYYIHSSRERTKLHKVINVKETVTI